MHGNMGMPKTYVEFLEVQRKKKKKKKKKKGKEEGGKPNGGSSAGKTNNACYVNHGYKGEVVCLTSSIRSV